MKKRIISIILVVWSFTIYGQKTGTIKGKIIEQSTKQPIAGATLFIKDKALGTVSDTLGKFTLENVPEGTYAVVISLIGFQQKILNDVIIIRDKTYYFEAELFDDAKNMNEVEVSTFKYENNPMTPVSSFSFGREEIFRSPGTQGDIFRAIGILPGVSSAGGQFSAIAVRGQGVRDNVYMVDDIPMIDLSHLSGSGSFNDPNGGRFSIFAPLVIDNAQFQGGGFAAQYGRKGSSFLGLGIKEGNQSTPSIVGQFDLLGGTLIYDGPSYLSKKTSVLASARYQNFYVLEKVVGLKGIGLPAFGDYMIKTTTQLNADNKLSFIAMYNNESYIKNINDIKAVDSLTDASLGSGTSDRLLVGTNLRTLTSRNSFWKNVLYFRGSNSNGSFGTSYPNVNAKQEITNKETLSYQDNLIRLKNNQSEFGYRSIFTTRIKNTTLTAGIDLARIALDYTRSASQNDTLFSFSNLDFRPSTSQKYIVIPPAYFNALFKSFAYNGSAYIDYSFRLFKRLTLSPGARYDYTGFTSQNTFSPRLSGSLEITQKQTINFATGVFYQDPLLEDIGDQSTSKNLKNEKTTQYIFGYKNYIFQDLKFSVETWYKQLDNLVTRPQGGQVLLNNNGTGHAYGVDVNITKRLSKKYYGQVGYSFMESKRNDHDGTGEYNFTYSQPHMFSILGSFKPNSKWVFSSKLRYATGRPKDRYILHTDVFNNPGYLRSSQEITIKNADRFKDYISWDVRIDYRVQVKKTSITIFLDIVDVTNRFNQSAQAFQPLTGRIYYAGTAIFPTLGLRIEM